MKTVCFLGMDGAGKSVTIPIVAKKLAEAGKDVAVMSSTKPVQDNPMTLHWRRLLVSKDTTPFERFTAAKGLYDANMRFILSTFVFGQPDFLLIDRGFSDLEIFNTVFSLDQAGLVPLVDYAFYFKANLDVLTKRLQERGGTDFQDTDINFRTMIFNEGPKTFNRYLSKTKGCEIDTSDITQNEAASQVVDFILQF